MKIIKFRIDLISPVGFSLLVLLITSSSLLLNHFVQSGVRELFVLNQEKEVEYISSKFSPSNFNEWPDLLQESKALNFQSYLEISPEGGQEFEAEFMQGFYGGWMASANIYEFFSSENNIWIFFIDMRDGVGSDPEVINKLSEYAEILSQNDIGQWSKIIRTFQENKDIYVVFSTHPLSEYSDVHDDPLGMESDEVPFMFFFSIDERVILAAVPKKRFVSTLIVLISWGVTLTVILLVFGGLFFRFLNAMQRSRKSLEPRFSNFENKKNQGYDILLDATCEYLNELEEKIYSRSSDWRDLLYSVAHEIRSPLSRISFALELLPKSKEHEDLHLDIVRAIDELNEMVGELLSYSRVDSPSEVIFSDTNVKQVIEKTCLIVEQSYPKANIQLLGPEMNVKFVSCQLERVVINLLRNACRYCKSEVLVSWKLSNSNWVLSIEDDGPGIPPGKRARVLEPFTRLDSSRSRDSGGAGLGLAIVKSICETHQGKIDISYSRLEGAKFELSFPIELVSTNV